MSEGSFVPEPWIRIREHPTWGQIAIYKSISANGFPCVEVAVWVVHTMGTIRVTTEFESSLLGVQERDTMFSALGDWSVDVLVDDLILPVWQKIKTSTEH